MDVCIEYLYTSTCIDTDTNSMYTNDCLCVYVCVLIRILIVTLPAFSLRSTLRTKSWSMQLPILVPVVLVVAVVLRITVAAVSLSHLHRAKDPIDTPTVIVIALLPVAVGVS